MLFSCMRCVLALCRGVGRCQIRPVFLLLAAAGFLKALLLERLALV
jgi:hypothetical protein